MSNIGIDVGSTKMDSKRLPRRWFQIHLSTAIVLMFVAGALMWVNFQLQSRKRNIGPVEIELGGRKVVQEAIEFDESMNDERVKELFWQELGLHSTTFEFRFQGWPATWRISYFDRSHYNNITGARWYLFPVAMNLLAAIILLGATAAGCEYWIRRKRK